MKLQIENLGKVSITVEGEFNKERAYDRLSLVLNGEDGISYVSKQPVPIGIDISNTKYWMPLNIGGNKYIIANALGNSTYKAISQKLVTDKFNEQEEINIELLSVQAKAKEYADLSKQSSESYLAAIEELRATNPDLAVAVEITKKVLDLETQLNGLTLKLVTEEDYGTMTEYDDNTLYLTYEEE